MSQPSRSVDGRIAPRRLAAWGVTDPQAARRDLDQIRRLGIPDELMATLLAQLDQCLARWGDADRVLRCLERFMAASRSPLALAALMERDPQALPILVQIFSTSQFLAERLIRDPAAYDLLRMIQGQPIAREVLVDEIVAEIETARDDAMALDTLRRYKHRETLRIAYGDIIGGQDIPTVTRQISYLAEALCEAAVCYGRRALAARWGTPRRPDGAPARFVVLALGKLGGRELNYSSDIDLVFLSEADGHTAGGEKSIGNQEYFERLARQIVRLLTEPTGLGIAYRVDLRLRPQGRQGPAVMSVPAALHYFETFGRTWERQAYIKARPIAGDRDLGETFLRQLEPWIYQRYLGRAEIAGIRAIKQKIEQQARRAGDDARNIKTGRGGLRDIEFVIQFLQLLNGSDLPEVRTPTTLTAIVALQKAGCLTHQESTLLEENYCFLRRIEHRLQMMFDLRTHTLPDDPEERRKLALRAGYADAPGRPAREVFESDLRRRTELNRRVLDHLLHDAFSDDPDAAPQTDLILDPDPDPEVAAGVLRPYGFQDVPGALRHLQALARERIRFLPSRRSRHFLASIAPDLLAEIGRTPDPDQTLVELLRVCDSLGGKSVLWELFQVHPPSLKLMVRLCAASPFLAGILVRNPGMIDYLLDSLLLDRLPAFDELDRALEDRARGAEDLEAILHAFKQDQILRIGVRDILGKDDIVQIHRALADVAEVCLRKLAEDAGRSLLARYGAPQIATLDESDAESGSLVIVAMGKFGGREPNYHSDLDVVFLYPREGTTSGGGRRTSTTHQHFFSQWAQRIVQSVNRIGPRGRLYEMDPRLRPTGRSGSLAVSFEAFRRYFFSGQGQLWERQALCKARPVFGAASLKRRVQEEIREILCGYAFGPEDAEAIREMRGRLEATASPWNLKRGRGGTVDIEFLAQMFQLAACTTFPEVLVPRTVDALAALARVGVLDAGEASYLIESYRFLRGVETGLRLLETPGRHELPEDPALRARLAYLLRWDDPQRLVEACGTYREENRRLFEALVARAKRGV